MTAPEQPWICPACERHNPALQEKCGGCNLRSTYLQRLIDKGAPEVEPDALSLPAPVKFFLEMPFALLLFLASPLRAIELWRKGDSVAAAGLLVLAVVAGAAVAVAVKKREKWLAYLVFVLYAICSGCVLALSR